LKFHKNSISSRFKDIGVSKVLIGEQVFRRVLLPCSLGRSVKTENRLIVTLEAGKVAFWLQYQLVKILERSVDVFCLRREVKVSKF